VFRDLLHVLMPPPAVSSLLRPGLILVVDSIASKPIPWPPGRDLPTMRCRCWLLYKPACPQ
jgi:hypothetical protein